MVPHCPRAIEYIRVGLQMVHERQEVEMGPPATMVVLGRKFSTSILEFQAEHKGDGCCVGRRADGHAQHVIQDSISTIPCTQDYSPSGLHENMCDVERLRHG